MTNLLDERSNRLNSAFFGVERKFITDLCLGIKLPHKFSGKLVKDAGHYYMNSRHHQGVNITPNGMMMPKVENVDIYNDFARDFFTALRSIGVFDRFAAWNVPAIRYKGSLLSEENAARPRASENAHSDSWLGWDQSAIVFMIPLLGDATNNYVQFFAHDLNETWIETLPSFTCLRALEMISQCTPMPWNYETGYIYPNDIGMVHQTVRNPGCGWRVSAEIVGYLDYPKLDSFGYRTSFSRETAEDIISGKLSFKAMLKMGEIGGYTESGRALELSIV